MSLYDDLGVGASDTKTEGWSKNFKLLQSQLKVKKAALTQAKTQRMKQSTVLAPVIDLKRGGSSEERQIIDTPPHVAAGIKDVVPIAFSSGDALIPLADEYDPMFPNDYEKVVKRHREERQRQREQERQKEIEEREKKRKDKNEGPVAAAAPSGFSRFPVAEEDSDEDDEYEKERRKRSMGGAAIAPPSSLVDRDGRSDDPSGSASFAYEDEGRPARGSKAAIPPPMFEDSDRPRSPPAPTSSFLANMGGTVAHKIMQKYGFREGQGLGKHEQGLSTALSVEKTSKRGGKIIIGDAAEKPGSSLSAVAETSVGGFSADPSKKSDANPLTEILKNPTKVVLLRNMVGRGEVDEDLEGETKEECEKYGKVIKCVIFEIAVVTDDEAVRIFLEFERVESAIKAVVDLNGRYFGGRVVKACFYNLDKFRVLDLGEQV
ncbi:putative splicing factor 45 isoform 3 [Scophthalmus maximus]|uniref:Splicing factor 45 n=1 Tax=Scophthalmus maximus TaxID=52904 RepID=A0A2U9B1X4_SCOMX|nr:splicing factor 45 isoform X1 [Scophthalmus maximus]XP_035466552.1 splicing factor 45 isoform X1 [Scophthalmus maximus]XP_035466560.1 splicing factor 45 isoform X1 [Scophthalmus maximus]AWO97761.1 putative splicing factor 45 isoform 3 [Scophthalmus maximus]